VDDENTRSSGQNVGWSHCFEVPSVVVWAAVGVWPQKLDARSVISHETRAILSPEILF